MIGIERVIIDYPEIIDFINFIGITGLGVMCYSGNAIKFNPAYFYEESKSLVKFCKEMSLVRHWINNCRPMSIGVHEASHALEYLLVHMNADYKCRQERLQAYNNCTEAKLIVDEAIKRIAKTPYGNGKSKKELIAEISKYATKNDAEALAEAFADVYTNKSKANPLSIEIKNVAKGRYKLYKNKNVSVKTITS